MFDFHLHSNISFDSSGEPIAMVRAAVDAGLKEICFTDHLDYDPFEPMDKFAFDTAAYNAAYDDLEHPSVKIRRGMEFGLRPDNADRMQLDLQRRPFDFVIGSIHFAEDVDIYFPQYWRNKTMDQAEKIYLEETLSCVQAHDGFDVLGHLTYISKAESNPTKRTVDYYAYQPIVDAIFEELIRKDKGIEINTSGIRACGKMLPHDVYVRRFKEMGGKIVTIGSDAHGADRVGEHCAQACEMLKEIFGYVCTFENRQPIFHKL